MTILQKQSLHLQNQVNIVPIVLPKESKLVGAIVNIEGALIQNTVAGKNFQKYGGYINFSPYTICDKYQRIISGIKVPIVPVTYQMNKTVIILHPLAVRINTVARVLEAVKDNTQNLSVLTKVVNKYYNELSKTIFGKTGIYNKNILGPRLKRSFRGVIIPGNYNKDILGESYEWVGIPRNIFKALDMWTGAPVIIGRDPTIWLGSLEFLRAYMVEHDAIEVHSLLLPQLAGDHDGDQCWGYYPKNSEQYSDIIASFLVNNSQWSKNYCDKKADTEVDWKLFRDDFKHRKQSTGLSVGPVDILNNTSDLQRIFQYCSPGNRTRGKFDINELIETCNQIPIDKWKKMSEMTNQAQLAMKIYIGPIGLLALRLTIIGHKHKYLEYSAHSLSERCAQALLDSKHLTYEQLKEYKPDKIFNILNLKDPSIQTVKSVYTALKNIIDCNEVILPILKYIVKDGRGLAKMSKEDFPLFEGITSIANNGEYFPDIVLDKNNFKNYDEGVFSYAFKKGLLND